MKVRWALIVSINLCCLMVLLYGYQLFSSAQAKTSVYTPVLIEAVYYDGYELQDADEAVAIRNLSEDSVDIGGWQLSDGISNREISADTKIPPFEYIWLAADGAAFRRHFGFSPDATLTSWPGFANSGDEVLLYDIQGRLVDAVVYGQGNIETSGWTGTAVQPYTVRGVFAAEGQILYRKIDAKSALPVPDSNSAADWAQDIGDVSQGRRVRFPGWDVEEFIFPVTSRQPSSLTISIAPDNAFETVTAAIDSARESIQITSLTFENLAISKSLVVALHRGVAVQILLEGSPVGGIADQEKAICEEIESAGGECWFMISDQDQRIHDRYRFMHAKYMIIDGNLALVNSENLSPNSMPYDSKSDGTWGRRGIIAITDAPEIVAALQRIFARDLDAENHSDIVRWQAGHAKYGLPSAGFVPIQQSGGVTYTVRFREAVHFSDVELFELQQAPENLLRDGDGILGLIGSAGEGDTLLIEQLQERPYWGSSSSSSEADPNLRLESFIAAARRGATVRLLLDDFFDEDTSPLSNAATCNIVNQLAKEEGLAIACRQSNPTGLGIHNKMILAHVDGRGYIHVGSWNGTELASKGNREVALLARSDAAYDYLSAMFEGDWPNNIYFPLLARGFWGYASHPLISEVLYDSHGRDEAEFIEIVNPTPGIVDLSGFGLGDAASRDDFEDVRRFPQGTIMQPHEVIVVALSASGFYQTYHYWPNFEIIDTMPAVVDLIDDPSWGDTAALLRLGNQGDEVILRDKFDADVDVVVYGSGNYAEQEACALVTSSGYSLERIPYWRDSDNCPIDFREWPIPNPGTVP
ncbi:MAG: phospholipase D-like domain-containing protein [Candidatus Promineifilaceae bacterium]